jgi:hypothetical protein
MNGGSAVNVENIKDNMNKTIWYPNVPTTPGIYWFNAGFSKFFGEKDRKPLILQITSHELYVFGDGGSMPLNMVYNEKFSKNAEWAHIKQPTKWVGGECIKEHKSRAWIKDKNGYVGVALVSPGVHYDVRADVVWLNHPHNAASHGEWIRNSEGYLYSPIKVPKI